MKVGGILTTGTRQVQDKNRTYASTMASVDEDGEHSRSADGHQEHVYLNNTGIPGERPHAPCASMMTFMDHNDDEEDDDDDDDDDDDVGVDGDEDAVHWEPEAQGEMGGFQLRKMIQSGKTYLPIFIFVHNDDDEDDNDDDDDDD